MIHLSLDTSRGFSVILSKGQCRTPLTGTRDWMELAQVLCRSSHGPGPAHTRSSGPSDQSGSSRRRSGRPVKCLWGPKKAPLDLGTVHPVDPMPRTSSDRLHVQLPQMAVAMNLRYSFLHFPLCEHI